MCLLSKFLVLSHHFPVELQMDLIHCFTVRGEGVPDLRHLSFVYGVDTRDNLLSLLVESLDVVRKSLASTLEGSDQVFDLFVLRLLPKQLDKKRNLKA